MAGVDAVGAGGRVLAAIGDAARATGIDFQYLMTQAKLESGLRPDARARTSSARGLYQFIERTWLSVVKQHGAKHGLGWAADAIDKVGGRLKVADGATRQAILALRNDPSAAAAMAAEHAADNKAALEARLGRAVGQVDLYMAHFLGVGGATKFLRALANDGSAAAADLMPRAARANKAVFHAAGGAQRSLEQVYARFASKFDGDGPASMPRPPAATMLAERGDALAPGPRYARTAYLMLAELGA